MASNLPEFVNEPGFRGIADSWHQIIPVLENFVRQFSYIDVAYIVTDQINDDIRGLPAGSFVVTSNKIVEPCSHLNIFELSHTYYGEAYGNRISYVNCIPTKKFNCFIRRNDVIRQSWFYLLERHNLLDCGYVSFHNDTSRHRQSHKSPREIFNDQFENHLTVFAEEHNKLKDRVPFANFDLTADLSDIILDSKCSIILETYFHDNRSITISEKTFRCLKLSRPWILFAMKGAVSYLRSIGLDVLDDLVDHTYDSVADPIVRQSIILEQAKKLGDLEFTDDVVARLNRAARHNQDLLQDWKNNWHELFTNKLKEITINALETY